MDISLASVGEIGQWWLSLQGPRTKGACGTCSPRARSYVSS